MRQTKEVLTKKLCFCLTQSNKKKLNCINCNNMIKNIFILKTNNMIQIYTHLTKHIII